MTSHLSDEKKREKALKKSKRCKAVYMSLNALAHFARLGRFQVVQGVPSDAVLVGWGMLDGEDMVISYFAHETFNEVEPDDEPPAVNVVIRELRDE